MPLVSLRIRLILFDPPIFHPVLTGNCQQGELFQVFGPSPVDSKFVRPGVGLGIHPTGEPDVDLSRPTLENEPARYDGGPPSVSIGDRFPWKRKLQFLRGAERKSPKTCSVSGQLHETPLSLRMMECDCDTLMDRELNAEKNLEEGGCLALQEGLKRAQESSQTELRPASTVTV